jgi:hypothetical protein
VEKTSRQDRRREGYRFDWSADTKALVAKGVVQASMVQIPFVMGIKGLQARGEW